MVLLLLREFYSWLLVSQAILEMLIHRMVIRLTLNQRRQSRQQIIQLTVWQPTLVIYRSILQMKPICHYGI